MEDLAIKRNSFNLSQAKLACLSGVSRFRIHQHEAGYSQLKHQEIAKIAEAFRLIEMAYKNTGGKK